MTEQSLFDSFEIVVLRLALLNFADFYSIDVQYSAVQHNTVLYSTI